MFFYLNTLDSSNAGGETHFPELEIKVPPKRGRMVLWANIRDDDPSQLDERVMHEALPVLEGEKRGAQYWIYQYDYQSPCTFFFVVFCEESILTLFKTFFLICFFGRGMSFRIKGFSGVLGDD